VTHEAGGLFNRSLRKLPTCTRTTTSVLRIDRREPMPRLFTSFRVRPLSVRLSEDEFRALCHACQLRGARSISEFARWALVEGIRRATEDESPIERKLASLEVRLSAVETVLSNLVATLQETNGRLSDGATQRAVAGRA
jgi:hypothetical protein